jgi:uncharacterized protein YecT (DUF1311 family)
MARMQIVLTKAAYKQADWANSVVLRYFPIAIVTTIEVFVRLTMQALIDRGPPFLDRAADLAKHVKFDFRTISALHGKEVSLGEIISHFVPLNDLASINSALTTLLGADFLKSIGQTRDSFSVRVKGETDAPPIIDDLDAVCRSIQKVMETRHIIVHELPRDIELSPEDVQTYLDHAELFLQAADEFIWEVIEPNAPLTQADMNAAAHEEFLKADRERVSLLEKLSKRGDKQRQGYLEESQAAWEKFRDSYALFEADFSRGGSIQPMEHELSRAQITDSLNEELKRLLGYETSVTER